MKPKKPADQPRNKIKRYRVTTSNRDFLADNLALLLTSDVPVASALHSISETAKTRNLRLALLQAEQEINDGSPLWKTLQINNLASPQTLALVRLGEESGNLSENLQAAASQEEKQRLFRAKIHSALVYPTFVFSVTLLVAIGVTWFLLPRLAETFAQLNTPLPLITKIFINTGAFLNHNGIWAIPLLLGIIYGSIYFLFFSKAFKRYGQSILLHFPGIGRLMSEVEISRFGLMLSSLLEAGLGITESLKLLETATNNYRYQKFYRELAVQFDEGFNFRTSLSKIPNSQKLLPPSVQQMLFASEKSGSMPQTLNTLGKIYNDKLELTTQNLESIVEPVLLIVVWFGVLGIAVAVIVPIYGLLKGINNV